MNQEQTFVGIDVGTTEVRTIVGMLQQDQEIPSVIGAGAAQNHGMRRGVVVNIDEVAAAIVRSIEEAERISGQRLNRALASVNGAHVVSLTSRGVVAIGGNDREVTTDDISRAEEAAAVVQLPANREILQVFARNFHLDGQDNIKDPIGMSGVRLEIDALIVTSGSPPLKALDRAMHRAGVTATHKIVAGLAASEAVLDSVQRESGAVVIDIGAATTNIVVVEEDDVQHVAILPVGSLHITNDLAIGLRTELGVAEKVKVEHTDLNPEGQKVRKAVRVEVSGENFSFENDDVQAIIMARLEELFEMINEELKKIERQGKLPGGAVLVGGGALMKGIDEVAKDELGLPAHIGTTSHYSGIVDQVKSPRFASAVGLMLLDMRLGGGSSAPLGQREGGSWLSQVRALLKKFVP